MSHFGFKTDLGRQLRHIQKISQFCLASASSIDQALDRRQHPRSRSNPKLSQTFSGPPQSKQKPNIGQKKTSRANRQNLSIAIVGAGFAGLACADELQKQGIQAKIFEAGNRTGGRCWSMGGEFGNADQFPGQVIERGGELIDSQHHTLLNYAREFGLEIEDLCATPGASAFYFKGSHYSEAAIVEEYLDLLKAITQDIHQISPQPTARHHSPFDAALDQLSLSEYLDKQQAGYLARAYIEASHQGEFGFSPDDQTCLHFLLTNLDPNLNNPIEVFGDERYHVQGGNEKIIRHLSQRLDEQIHLQHRLVALRKTSSGAIALSFDCDGTTITKTFDIVVLTVPFPALRSVDFHTNLNIPDWKQQAIAHLDNSKQAKMMVNFTGRPWRDHHSTGFSHSDLAHHQVTWEANPSQGDEQTQGTIVNLASGNLGLSLDPDQFETQAQEFLQDFDRIYPGAHQQARRDATGRIQGHIEQWSTNPFVQGAYLCYRPGQLTQFTGLEGIAIDNLLFAGEHTDSFYEWQGFLEGAALSGIATARQILTKLR